jgi:hypothetical protein
LAAQFGVDAGALTVALEDAVRVHLVELHPGGGSSLTGASRSSYPTRGADGPPRVAPEVAMPYAEGRTYYDADSHLMELADWLVLYADPGIRDRIRPLCMRHRSGSCGWR